MHTRWRAEGLPSDLSRRTPRLGGELPEEGWTSTAMAIEMGRPFSPWWWADRDKAGNVHYVEVLSTSAWEEIYPKFLCGITSDNVWLAEELSQEALCPQCLMEAKERDLPLT